MGVCHHEDEAQCCEMKSDREEQQAVRHRLFKLINEQGTYKSLRRFNLMPVFLRHINANVYGCVCLISRQ